MNIKTMMIGVMGGLLVLCSGCGDSKLGEECDEAMNLQQGFMRSNKVREFDITGSDITVSFNAEDELYYQCYHKSYGSFDESDSLLISASDFAFAKRKAALNMSREVFCYSFKNYLFWDGVSGLIYNVSYIMQAPHKALRGLRAMDGVWRYVKSLVKLVFGVICAIVGVVVAPIFNTLCHPFETLSNLFVGVVHICDDTDSPVSWFGYVFRTNIIASLWDLIWGGMIYPLWQALIFWL